MTTSSKVKSSFAIDDILSQKPSGSKILHTKSADSTKSDIVPNSTTLLHDRNELPKASVPLFPTMFEFNPSKYYFPHMMGSHQRFSSNAYMEQYASALQKASPNLWPFYSHPINPYNSYIMPSCGFKRKGGQVRFTPQQTQNLERRFVSHKYLSPEDRKQLANQLKLSDRQVKTWFQNRRAKWRRINTVINLNDKESDRCVDPLNLQIDSLDLHKNINSAECILHKSQVI